MQLREEGNKMKSGRAIWERSQDALRGEMTPVSYNAWISGIEPICVDGNTLILLTSNDVAKNTLRNIYSQVVANAVNSTNGTQLDVRFIDSKEREGYPYPQAVSESYARENALTPSIRSTLS